MYVNVPLLPDEPAQYWNGATEPLVDINAQSPCCPTVNACCNTGVVAITAAFDAGRMKIVFGVLPLVAFEKNAYLNVVNEPV